MSTVEPERTQPDASGPAGRLLHNASGPAGRPPHFEDHLKSLEEILRRLERGDLTLDDSVAEYERGIRALRACRAALDGAERRIEELVRVDGDQVELRPFAHEPVASGPPPLARRG